MDRCLLLFYTEILSKILRKADKQHIGYFRTLPLGIRYTQVKPRGTLYLLLLLLYEWLKYLKISSFHSAIANKDGILAYLISFLLGYCILG